MRKHVASPRARAGHPSNVCPHGSFSTARRAFMLRRISPNPPILCTPPLTIFNILRTCRTCVMLCYAVSVHNNIAGVVSFTLLVSFVVLVLRGGRRRRRRRRRRRSSFVRGLLCGSDVFTFAFAEHAFTKVVSKRVHVRSSVVHQQTHVL